MKIEGRLVGESEDPSTFTLTTTPVTEVRIREVYQGLAIVTDDGAEFGICLRDTGLEIRAPDGTVVVVGVKYTDTDGDVFVERGGRVVR